MNAMKEIVVELYTNTLTPGIILKGDCFDDNGHKVIDSSKPVTEQEIDFIKLSNIKKVFYKTNRLSVKNPVAKNIITDQSVSKALTVLQDIEHQLKNNKLSIPAKELKNVVENFLSEMTENENAYLNLLDVSDLDEYTYTHSINTSTISIMMGIALNLDNQKVFNLGIAGLLMDIGKSMVPKDILFKKTGLTPEETKILKNHTIYGFNLLKNDPEMNKDILDGVLFHHEHYMGDGYPFKLGRDKLSYVPQILAISDAFDAGTANRPYRDANTYTQLISYIMQNSGKKFNPIYSQIFLNHMIKKIFDKPLYFEGAYVLLNTNEIAYVVGSQSGDPFSLRPIINIIFNPQAREKVLKYHQQINLEKDVTRQIIRRIDDMETVEKLVRMECKGDISCVFERQKGFQEKPVIAAGIATEEGTV